MAFYPDSFDNAFVIKDTRGSGLMQQLDPSTINLWGDFGGMPVFKDRNIRAPPVTNIERTLAMIGIRKVGLVNVNIDFFPHERKFDVFSTAEFMFRGVPIVKVDIPKLGAESVSKSMLNNASYSTVSGTVVHAQTKVTHVVGGVREKIDGIEVVQFVIHTSDGKSYGIIYGHNSLQVIDPIGVAVYEYRQNNYYLLTGTPYKGLQSIPHLWKEPTRDNLMSLSGTEGAILNVNGIEHRVKSTNSVTLQCFDEVAYDRNSVVYPIQQVVPDGCNEFEIDGDNMHFIKCRPDKTVPDTTHAINKMKTTPEIKDVLRFFPVVESSVEVFDVVYTKPCNTDIVEAKSNSLQGNCEGPMTWCDKRPRPITTSEALVERVANVYGEVNSKLIHQYAHDIGVFLVGQTVVKSNHVVPDVKVSYRDFVVSTRPNKFTRAVYLLEFGDNDDVLKQFNKAVLISPLGQNYFCLYVTHAVDGVSNIHFCDKICVIHQLLEDHAYNVNELKKILDIDKPSLMSLLYSRRDLFVKGDDNMWGLVRNIIK